MTTTTSTRTVHVHRVYIRAAAQRVWDALLSPEWTDRYGYGGFVQSDLQAGGPFVTTAGSGMQEYGITGPIVDGEVIESDRRAASCRPGGCSWTTASRPRASPG